MLPTSTSLAPVRPLIGERTLGIVETEPGRIDLRLVRLDRRLNLPDQCVLLIVILLRLDAFWQQRGSALKIGLGADKLGLIFVQRGGRLSKDGLKRASIDLEEKIARLYVLAFGEVDAHNLTIDAARDGDRVKGLHRADRTLVYRYILCGGDPEGYRNCRRGCRRSDSLLGAMFLPVEIPADGSSDEGEGYCITRKWLLSAVPPRVSGTSTCWPIGGCKAYAFPEWPGLHRRTWYQGD
jgi:hypothetical protein